MSAVAHDLRVQLRSFEVTLDGTDVKGVFDLKSLLVEGPVENDVLYAERYDDGKRAEVAKAMHGQVLHTDKYPRALFTGSATPSASRSGGYRVVGELELAGSRRPSTSKCATSRAATAPNSSSSRAVGGFLSTKPYSARSNSRTSSGSSWH